MKVVKFNPNKKGTNNKKPKCDPVSIFLPAVVTLAGSLGAYLACKEPELIEDAKRVFSDENLVGVAIKAFLEGTKRKV